jgi:hypothetical protein
MIRENCLLIDQVLENLSVREREVGEAQIAFQEAVIATINRESEKVLSFPFRNRPEVILC